jgi:serine/threonine protein kinase
MEPIASLPSPELESRARRIAAELRFLIDSHVDRSVIIETAVDRLMRLGDSNGSFRVEECSRWLSSIDESLRSSICRQLEVDGYLLKQSWFRASATESVWPQAGDRVDGFSLIEELGRGHRSRVFLCRQAGVGDRQVVVKFAHGAPLEADVLGRLRHPNIVPVYSVAAQAGEMSYLCMPFLGRSTLGDYVAEPQDASQSPNDVLSMAAVKRRRPTDCTTAGSTVARAPHFYSRSESIAWLGWQLATALSHAHEQGIVHGDVKPSNVLLSWDGSPLLMDFNLSGSHFHAVEAKGGTLPYMPPEQLQGFAGRSQDAAYDHRSDLFSLGVLLYESLVGRLPFLIAGDKIDRESYVQELLQSQRRGFTSIRSIDRSIPTQLAEVVERCLRYVPDERIPTAAAVSELLGLEFSNRRRLAKGATQHWSKLAVAAAVAGLSIGIATFFVLSRPPEHVRLFLDGARLVESGEFAQATAAFDRSLTLNPDSNEIRFALGNSLLKQGEVARAQDCFHEVYRRERSARGAAYVGYCMSLRGKMNEAIAWYTTASEHADPGPEVHNNLAVAYELGKSGTGRINDLLAARQHLSHARESLPTSDVVKYNWLRLQLVHAETIGSIITRDVADLAITLAESLPDEQQVQISAARALVQRSAIDPSTLPSAAECLKQAVRLGFDLSPNSAEWRRLHATDAWPEILQLSQAMQAMPDKRPSLVRSLEPVSLTTTVVPREDQR